MTAPDFPSLTARIERAMQCDRYRLRGLLRRIDSARRDGKPWDGLLEQFTRIVEPS